MTLAVVGGVLAGKPGNGGESWVRASWVLGLRRLGFDVHLVEVLAGAWAEGDPRERFACSGAAEQLAGFVDELCLHGQVSVVGEHGHDLYGRPVRELEAMIGEADVLFDLSGHLGASTLAGAPRLRVYVDLDPGFTQAWHADPSLEFTLCGYDSYVTVGLNVGAPSCPIPTAGVHWLTTLPPVLLERWASEPLVGDPYRFTTVARWRSAFGPISIDGRELGLKHHEFRRLLDLPERVPGARFELALDIDPADAPDLAALREHGWSVLASSDVAATPRAFGDYVRRSCAECSAAQPAYVQTASGWFSDRTAAYLAAGRPALVQDTGLARRLETGEGLVTFSTPADAAQGARRIAAAPLAHSEAARSFAQEHLDSDRVLGGLLDELAVAC